MKIWLSVDVVISRILKWSVCIALFCVVAIMVLATLDIITTKLFNFPIPGTGDLITQMNVPLVYMAMAYVQLDRGHLNINLVDKYLPKKVSKAILVSGYIMGILVSGFVSWQTLPLIKSMTAAGTTNMGAIRFVLWPFALITCMGFFFLMIAFILSSIRELTRKTM